MNKIKKILAACGAFFVGMVPNVFAMVEMVQTKYGVYAPTPVEKASIIGKIVIPIILFVIGLFSLITKKIAKRLKLIIIVALIALGVIGCYFMDFISINF